MEAALTVTADRDTEIADLARIKRPHTLEETGLDRFFVADLLLKHLQLVVR